MRPTIRLVLLIAGLATLFAIIAAGSAAGVGVTFENADFPDVAYVDEEVTVSFSLVLDGYTWDQVDVAGATYKEGFIGEFYNHTIDTTAVYADGNEALTFSVTITMPDTAGERIMWGFCLIEGFYTDYTQNLGTFEVKDWPAVQLAGTFGWDVVNREHEVMARVQRADASEIEEVSVYWDTVSHKDEGQDKALYPNRSAVITHQLLDPYYFNITLPGESCVVYILIHALINGRDFYDTLERAISVIEEPSLDASVPVAAFKGTNVVVAWTISNTAGTYITDTSVYWDTVSHSSAMTKENYAYRSDVLAGNDSRAYEVMLAMPGDEDSVYLVIHCTMKLYGYEFYTDEELQIPLIDEPTVTVTQHADEAFVDEDVQFVWTVSAPGDAVEETAIHWDTTSHAGSIDVASYPHASLWFIGEDDRTYDVTFEMPATPGTVYFIAHAKVLGQDFYVADELSINVRALPTVSITTVPDEGLAGSLITVEWVVTGAEATDAFGTFVHWDTTSHIDEPLPSNYAEHSQSIDWDLSGSYSFQLNLPPGAGTVYLIVSADVQGETFVDPNEVAITVKVLPSVAGVNGPAKLDGGKRANITFTLEDVDDPEEVEVLWDTESHDNATDYANSVQATDNGDGTWTVEFKVPDKDTEVFYRVHVQDEGADVYSDEATIKVKESVDDSPGPGFVMAVFALSLLAVLVASSRRR